MSAASRPLTPAEKYFAFLDPVSPMNLLLVAHLDRCHPIDLVAEHWARFVARRVTTRLQVHGDLSVSDAGPSTVDFAGAELPTHEWDAELARESVGPFGLDRPMGCRYLTSPEEGRARLYLTVHHAVADGRGGVADLQAFLRFLDGQPVPEQSGLPAPGNPRARYDWQIDKQELISLLRNIKARQADRGPVSPAPWPRPQVGASAPRAQSLILGSGELALGAKRNDTKIFAAIASAWLSCVAELVCDIREPTLQLATPVDLATRAVGSDQLVAPAIGVLSDRYRVDPSRPWHLAREIQRGIASATLAGEGELFFHLARIDRITDFLAGSKALERTLTTVPASVSVTNLGVIDPGTDPAWVRGMCGYLAPSPNHVAFVSGAGYRGRLVQSVMTSDVQLSPTTAKDLVQAYRGRSHDMATP